MSYIPPVWTTTGTNTGTSIWAPSMSSSTVWVNDSKPIPRMEMEEFMAIKDKDLQVYILNYAGYNVVTHKNISVKVDNDKKVGFYLFNHSVQQNQSSTFYIRKQLHQYIVYDKEKKTLKKSRIVSQVSPDLLSSYFKNPFAIEKFKISDSAEFYKQVICGKIKTVEDILKFNRSYVLRNKTLSLNNLYYTILFGDKYCLSARVYENFNDLTVEELKSLTLGSKREQAQQIYSLNRKINSKDINKYDNIRKEFIKEQGDKFTTYKESRQCTTSQVHQQDPAGI